MRPTAAVLTAILLTCTGGAPAQAAGPDRHAAAPGLVLGDALAPWLCRILPIACPRP